jgi:hypothetical protein
MTDACGPRHRLALRNDRDIHVPSIVVSQAWRDSRRQVPLCEFLAACDIAPVGLETAKAAGVLCGRAGIVDAAVVMAASLGAIIWTSYPNDIHALIDSIGVKPVPVVRTV